MPKASGPVNRELFWPYFAPYFAYVLFASIPSGVLRPELNQGLKFLVVASILLYCRKSYGSLAGPNGKWASVGAGVLAGLVGIALWIPLVGLFTTGEGKPWGDGAFYLRLASAALLVPFVEELFARRFVLGVTFQWDTLKKAGVDRPFDKAVETQSINSLPPGAWTWRAAVVSTLVFAAGHQPGEWLAATLFGALMVLLVAVRKDLLSCVVAHGVANLSLALYVRSFGAWQYW